MRHGRHISRRLRAPEYQFPWGGLRSSSVSPEAFEPATVGAPTRSEVWRPLPWEYTSQLPIASFVIGTERGVIGEGFESQGPGPVPPGYRGVIYDFVPYAVDAAGNLVDVLLAGTTVFWRLFAGNKPIPALEIYGIAPFWKNRNARSIAELLSGEQLRVTCTITANGMGITQLGARIDGRMEPLRATLKRPPSTLARARMTAARTRVVQSAKR